jgi:putative DNA-invertase from lambdoid prophage Rac
MKAAVYLRVSTGRQDEANQEPECLRLCEARGWEPVIVREQESGAKRRPAWDRVKGLVHRGEVGRVVVWALDRAGRDRVQLAQDWREILAKGGKLVSVREPWTEQDGPMQALLVEVVAYFAEAERARIIERIRAGQERARGEGKHLGRRWLDQDVVNTIRREYVAGISSFIAAKALRLPESTVRTYYKRFMRES